MGPLWKKKQTNTHAPKYIHIHTFNRSVNLTINHSKTENFQSFSSMEIQSNLIVLSGHIGNDYYRSLLILQMFHCPKLNIKPFCTRENFGWSCGSWLMLFFFHKKFIHYVGAADDDQHLYCPYFTHSFSLSSSIRPDWKLLMLSNKLIRLCKFNNFPFVRNLMIFGLIHWHFHRFFSFYLVLHYVHVSLLLALLSRSFTNFKLYVLRTHVQ